MKLSNQDLCQTALLAAFIAVSGSLKIPSIIPGSEFQLSAPIAVAICGVFGIRRYLIAGIAASLVCLLLGTQNFFNVMIALCFRTVIAGMFITAGQRRFFYIAAGPVASMVSRLALSLFVGQAAWALVTAAIPGMIFTAVTAPALAAILQRLSFARREART